MVEQKQVKTKTKLEVFLAFVLISPAVFLILFFAIIFLSLIARKLGGCTGALGSGVSCSGGQFFSSFALLPELSMLFLIVFAIPFSIIYLICACIFIFLQFQSSKSK